MIEHFLFPVNRLEVINLLLDNIKHLCRENKISICALERTLGIGNGTIGGWGIYSPRLDIVKKVADYFGVTVDELLKEDNHE